MVVNNLESTVQEPYISLRSRCQKMNSGRKSCVPLSPEVSLTLLIAAGALFVMMSASTNIFAAPPEIQSRYTTPVEAQYRGCDAAGWCRFWIEALDPLALKLLRVYPDGVPRGTGNEAIAIAVRDRLNALLASMVHQHKRIVLRDIREVEDGTFAAVVTVNEANLASDAILVELLKKFTGTK